MSVSGAKRYSCSSGKLGTRLVMRLTCRHFRTGSIRIIHFAFTGRLERRMKVSAVLSKNEVARKAGCRNSRPGAKKSRYSFLSDEHLC